MAQSFLFLTHKFYGITGSNNPSGFFLETSTLYHQVNQNTKRLNSGLTWGTRTLTHPHAITHSVTSIWFFVHTKTFQAIRNGRVSEEPEFLFHNNDGDHDGNKMANFPAADYVPGTVLCSYKNHFIYSPPQLCIKYKDHI